jgi:cytochrome c-type biogenesis protein CcmH
MSFWIVPSLMAIGITAMLALVLLRSRTQGDPPAAYDLRVYREQLREIDRDLKRGVIAEADAERIRTEVSRRILAADAQMQKHASGADAQPRRLTLITAAVCGTLMIGGSLWLYRDLGAPGYEDMSLALRIAQAEETRATRPSQAEAEADMPPVPAPEVEASYVELVEKLRATVAERPGDIEGHSLLARHEANLGNFKAAYEAKTREIELLTSEAGPDQFADQAELMILAAGGYVSPEAEAALRRALEIYPGHGPARYYWGLMLAQVGRPDMSFRLWELTLRQSPPDAPWLNPIRAQIEEMAWRAGVDDFDLANYAPRPAAPGPDADAMAAANDMTPEERQQMIRGMVDGLAERLATEGGSPDEWARLIGALGVLGDTDRARAIWEEARVTFSDNDAALAMILSAAIRAGLVE